MTKIFCDTNCEISRGGAGPWDDQIENFSNIKHAHMNCIGFQVGEPKLKGKENWGHTEIEKEYNKIFFQNIDKWIYDLVLFDKNHTKNNLIKNKLENTS